MKNNAYAQTLNDIKLVVIIIIILFLLVEYINFKGYIDELFQCIFFN